ncbi:chromatin licensing and DNA replication factor double parked [Arctopsyche grandis]|uniref:chromatin licensing and DNA replication factor double parked n=1 Tax=Arctopsyche grandis TaxID=121162 RepID=UPI00406D73FA
MGVTKAAPPLSVAVDVNARSGVELQEETMAQASITNYYSVRSLKRKFSTDGELHPNKIHLLQLDSLDNNANIDKQLPSRAVTKLTFEDESSSTKEVAVPFRKLSPLSPVKNPAPTPRPSPRNPNLGDIKKALGKSSRLRELKSKLNSFNANYDKLQDEAEQSSRKTLPKATLKEFKSIELLVPVSPKKQASPFTSPIKEAPLLLRSPIKSPTKLPAFQRFSSLATAGSTLTLPHHYRWLAEVFRAVETACALLHNRRETVTFSKVKPAAQDMLKRNITEKHLEQIKFLSPNMYSFSREKLKNFGMTSKRDEYDLVITPIIVHQVTGSPVDVMNPSVILERRRSFYNMLVEKVKDHHDEYLKSLDPPLKISRVDLKVWHPEFDVDRIPDVESDALPPEPHVERFSTAQDVLSKAKQMFSNNPRVERALQRLADLKSQEKSDETDDPKYSILHSSQSTQTIKINLSPDAPLVNPALKGIPNALLQKVKARQAEKALQTMTRTIMQNENILIYQRLPDLAKILRNVFITERKGILPLDFVIAKLDNSFASKMSHEELVRLLRCLSEEVPEWLTFHIVRKVDYLKLAKKADMTNLIKKLEAAANKNMP